MMKLKNSVYNLLESEKRQINQLEVKEATKIHLNKINLFIDIRDIREIKNSARVLGAKCAPKNMLRFWIDPNNLYHQEVFNENFNFIFHCASSWLSALAKLTPNNIRLLNTSHLIAGCNKWLGLLGPTEETG